MLFLAEEKNDKNQPTNKTEQNNSVGKEDPQNSESDSIVTKFLMSNLKDVLNEGIFFYTFIAFLGAIVIGFLALGIDRNDHTNNWAEQTAIFLATSWIIANFILMLFAFYKPTQKKMFIKGEYRNKLIFAFTTYGSAIGLTIIYKTFPPTGFFTFLGYNNILPMLFGIIYVLWNTIQVIFYKEWMTIIAKNSEIKYIINVKYKQKAINARIFLIISVCLPIILYIISIFKNWSRFFTYVDPANPTEQELLGVSFFWVWIVLMGFVILLFTHRQIDLFKRADDFGCKNVFLSTFNIIIWIIFNLKITSIINSIYRYFHQDIAYTSEFWRTFGDVSILLISLIFVFWLGLLAVRRVVQNYGLPFLVFILTLCCAAGQVVMTTEFRGRDTMNLINDIIVTTFSLTYYYWYAGYVLRRIGYIQRKVITVGEVSDIINEFSDKLANSIPQIESNIETEKDFIYSKYKIPRKTDRDREQVILDSLQAKRWGPKKKRRKSRKKK